MSYELTESFDHFFYQVHISYHQQQDISAEFRSITNTVGKSTVVIYGYEQDIFSTITSGFSLYVKGKLCQEIRLMLEINKSAYSPRMGLADIRKKR